MSKAVDPDALRSAARAVERRASVTLCDSDSTFVLRYDSSGNIAGTDENTGNALSGVVRRITGCEGSGCGRPEGAITCSHGTGNETGRGDRSERACAGIVEQLADPARNGTIASLIRRAERFRSPQSAEVAIRARDGPYVFDITVVPDFVIVPEITDSSRGSSYVAVFRNVTGRRRRDQRTRRDTAQLDERFRRLRDENRKLKQTIRRRTRERGRALQSLRGYRERVQSMSTAVSLADQRERRRIAEELHNGIGQSLVRAGMELGMVLRNGSTHGFRADIEAIQLLVRDGVRASRGLILDLSPPVLFEQPFELAVEWLTHRFTDRHDMKISFSDDGRPKEIDEDIRVLLFMGVRELLINVHRHAFASRVRVAIERRRRTIRVSVADDGKGFRSDREPPEGRYGLFGLREHLSALGGNLRVSSVPGAGSTITMIAPILS